MIRNVSIDEAMKDSFLTYAEDVAINRSIPDARDGLKLGLRQALYAQYTNKLTHKYPYKKAQKSVAAAMSQSYVHGDSALYSTIIRAAKPFVYRYPLEEAQGSYGTPSAPDNESASRYVECRSSELSDVFFDGLNRNAIERWYNNYDDTEQIPSCFPSIGYWNGVNGCSGIAVGFTTSINPTNLVEVNEAIIKLINNPNEPFDNIVCYPDYPSGCTLINKDEVYEALKNGTGKSARMRAKLEYDASKNCIIATHIPFNVFTNTIMSELSAITEADEGYGINKVIDATKKEAEIRIYLAGGTNPSTMINKLYRDTSLESFFAINMVMLDEGRYPKVFSWREALLSYIKHIRTCKYRECEFDKNKLLVRNEALNGLLIAIANIEDVIKIIKNSASTEDAANALIAAYSFTDIQVKAILDLKLQRLAHLEALKISNEVAENNKRIAELDGLLTTPSKLDEELIKIIKEVSEKFGDERRTEIINLSEVDEEIEIEEENVSVYFLSNDMIRICDTDALQGAKRGRKGLSMKLPKGVSVETCLDVTNLSNIFAISKKGKMFSFRISDLNKDFDYSIYNLIKLAPDDKILLLIDGNKLNFYKYIGFITHNGMIKRSLVSEYLDTQSRGIVAITLKDEDYVVSCCLSSGENDKYFITASNGKYVYFDESDISVTGRVSQGVRAIKLKNDEYVVGGHLIQNGLNYLGVLSFDSTGYGKITNLADFPMIGRANQGNTLMKLHQNSYLASSFLVDKLLDKIHIINDNKVVTIDVSVIPVQGRATSGIKLIDLDKIGVLTIKGE